MSSLKVLGFLLVLWLISRFFSLSAAVFGLPDWSAKVVNQFRALTKLM
ncbi:MAG: hypothetical protein K2I85_07040 [Alistipes sp.]|nr:hypothetical protein [Alistipes sp.]